MEAMVHLAHGCPLVFPTSPWNDLHMGVLLGLLIAVVTALITWQAFSYTRRRDSKIDIQNAWVELHKAMVDVQAKRAIAMTQVGQQGAYGPSGPNAFVELQKGWALAVAQLQGQLDRMEDDPLRNEILEFLKGDNKPIAYWQMPAYAAAFESLCQKVAVKTKTQV